MLKLFKNVFYFLAFLAVPVGLLAIFSKTPSLAVVFFGGIIGYVLLLSAWSIFRQGFTVLAERAEDVIHLFVDESGEGVHLITTHSLRGGEWVSETLTDYLHSFVLAKNGKLREKKISTLGDDDRRNRWEIEDAQKCLSLESFQKSLQFLSRKSGLELCPLPPSENPPLQWQAMKGKLRPETFPSTGGTWCLHSQKENTSTLSQVVWSCKLTGVLPSKAPRPVILNEDTSPILVIATKKKSSWGDGWRITAVDLNKGRVLWSKKV